LRGSERSLLVLNSDKSSAGSPATVVETLSEMSPSSPSSSSSLPDLLHSSCGRKKMPSLFELYRCRVLNLLDIFVLT
jgi:hypothetical protein